MGGHGKFSWVRPEVYPLIAAVGVACLTSVYSMGRHLWTNPEVFPTKSLRSVGVPEDELDTRAHGYKDSIYRSLQKGRTGETHIF